MRKVRPSAVRSLPRVSIRSTGVAVSRRVVRHLAAAIAGSLVVTVAVPTSPVVGGPSCYPPPVEAPVVDGYRAPACRYCAGHRGIDFGARRGDSVRAVAAGVVAFAGTVAGTRYVVVAQVDGLRATYGGLDRVLVSTGVEVRVGRRLATAAGQVYFGLRQGDEYLDPTPRLGRWRRPARLVPTDGSARPPAPSARLECPDPARDR